MLRNNYHIGLNQKRSKIIAYLHKSTIEVAPISEEANIMYDVLIIKKEQNTRCN